MSSSLMSRVAAMALACLLVLMMAGSCIDASAHSGRKIIVGGTENWRFGYNYSDWAMKAAPFLVGDTLVFKYKPASDETGENHNVYRLHSHRAYEYCSFGRSTMLANTTQGDPGFEFTLTQRKKPIYFACRIGNGVHCNEGMMKFWVKPL